MDREVLLKFGEEEVSLGFVSEFLHPQEEIDGGLETRIASEIFDKIREAIIDLDLGGFETEPIIITIK